jgi:tRNA(Arg) A34 adenosine deaminase TadA
VNDVDLEHLRRAVDLAEIALEAGEEPYGSVLVGADGTVLMEDHNRTSGGDQTRHPEFELARWAANHLAPADRATATVYTSGEHCAMCSAAHGWVGLGRIVYAVSSAQLGAWRSAWGAGPSPVAPLSIREVVPGAVVDGPVPQLEDEVRDLHRRFAHRAP